MEQWKQEWLSKMLSKVLEATFEKEHLNWDLNNKDLLCEDLNEKKLRAARRSMQSPCRWEVFGPVGTMEETAWTGWARVREEDGKVGRNQIIWDWIGLTKHLHSVLSCYSRKSSKGLWTRENVNWSRGQLRNLLESYWSCPVKDWRWFGLW